VLTCDGAGDQLAATVRVMGPGGDRVLATTPWQSSLGIVYSWVTFGMGFVPLEHEYKLMGMAPYAPDKAAREVGAVLAACRGVDAGERAIERKTFLRTNDLWNTLSRDLRGVRFAHICAGLQWFTEDLLTRWARNAVDASGQGDVLAAGGVFMNVKAN